MCGLNFLRVQNKFANFNFDCGYSGFLASNLFDNSLTSVEFLNWSLDVPF